MTASCHEHWDDADKTPAGPRATSDGSATAVIALILALSAAMSWGVSDFLGGVTTSNLPVTRVLAMSQPLGLAVCSIALLATGQKLPTGAHLVESGFAGAAAVLALGLLYVALANGSAVIVAPLAAIGAGVPVAVGVARGDPVTAVTLTATALALLGIVGSSWAPEEGRTRPASLMTIALALGAAASTGIYLTLIDDASSSGNPLGVVEALRFTASAIAIAVFIGVKQSAYWHRSSIPGPGQHLPIETNEVALQTSRRVSSSFIVLAATLGVGATDAAAESAFAAASEHGHLSVVAVVAGLYPVFTVLLALVVLQQRVQKIHALAAVAALAGVVLFTWS